MTLDDYKATITEFLARQQPPVVLKDDDAIWIVVRIAHAQRYRLVST
jgi:hypothetical protein